MLKIKFLYPFLLIATIAILNSCYISRPLKEPKTIKIITNFEPEVTSYSNSKYINNHTALEYKQSYIKDLINELDIYNLLETDKDNPDFTLVINSLDLSENISTETVDDEKSEYNGQSFEVSSCSVTAHFTLYEGDMKKIITKTFASSNKDEKITNNRNLGDYIFGTNKDNLTYHFKSLSDDIFVNLSEKTGRRTVAKITKKIHKAIKKS